MTAQTIEEKNDAIEIRYQSVATIQGGTLFILKGYLDTENSPFFYRQISKFISNGSVKLLFDCAALTYISSTGIGAIIRLHKELRQLGGDMVLFRLTPRVLEIFSAVGIQNFINQRGSLQAALRFFGDSFSKVFGCPVCGHRFKARSSGRFRCSGCKTILIIDEGGNVRTGYVPEDNDYELVPEKTEKAIRLLGELAGMVRTSAFGQEEKASFKRTLGQIVLNLYQREVKDVWAELEEVRN